MRIKSSLYFIVVLLTLSNPFGRTSGSRARFSKRITTMERLKKEKMRSKCAYTKNRNKLMMVMEGGFSSRMQVMETLNVFTDAYDGVLRAYEDLDTYYQTVEDSGNLRALSNDMEAIEEDFNEVEGIVKGYLNGASRSSIRGQTETSARDQAETKRLREEVSKQEEELSQIGQEIEKAYADCKRQLAESLHSEKQSYSLLFSSTPSSSAYVPSSSRQLPFSGGQAYSINQPFSISTSDQISADSSALLKKVSIPKFFGQKKNYKAWKAAFYSCVARTNATPEYKLLRLRECLQGEPLKVIESLGHSAAAYEAAKSRLERKYGGK